SEPGRIAGTGVIEPARPVRIGLMIGGSQVDRDAGRPGMGIDLIAVVKKPGSELHRFLLLSRSLPPGPKPGSRPRSGPSDARCRRKGAAAGRRFPWTAAFPRAGPHGSGWRDR